MKLQALEIIKKLQQNGYEALFCGGCVRDLLLGLIPADYDVATSAIPDVIESLFDKTIAVGKAFGVIVVVLDGYEIEVATFRSDSDYSDGRRPDSVTFCSMEEDAKRRDITINGMFQDPIKGQIIDYVGGQQDLKDGLIRLIGDPNARLMEDKLRLMRCIRFASRFNFKVVPETLEAIKCHAAEIVGVSAERVADELLKIFRAGNYKTSFNLLFKTNLIEYILPEIKAMKGIEQPPDYHPEGDVLLHTLKALECLPDDASDTLRIGALLHDVGKPATQTFEDRIRFNRHELKGKDITRDILQRLKFSNDFTDQVVSLVENHMKFVNVKKMRLSRLKRFMSMPKFDEHMALHRADCLSSHEKLDNYEFIQEKLKDFVPEEVKPVQLVLPPRIITGYDLLEMGFKQGPLFKTILIDVEDKHLEGVLVDKEQALEYIRKVYN